MRFDYHPPNLKYKSFHLRRLISANLIFIAIGCILCAIFAKKPEAININIKPSGQTIATNTNNSSSVKNPKKLQLASEQTKPTLSLDGHAPIEEELGQAWETITVQVGDTIHKLFQQFNISVETLNKLLHHTPAKKEFVSLKPGQQIDFLFDDLKKLKAIKLTLSAKKVLYFTSTDNGFKYHYQETKPTKKIEFAQAKITGSLYSAAQNAGLNERLILQMANILGYEIDFNLDIRQNDSFKILYEEEYIRDKKIDGSKILAIEFINQGKTYHAIHYTDEKGNEGYYSPEGYSLQKAFLRSPVAFTRISSHFSNGRRHPVLHKIRAHKGVDYAAPHGTPVKSAGDGKIAFIGVKGGYGKSIEVVHGNKYSTFYAHLSKYNSKLKAGASVKQGQVIGYVGSTGLATGPHLHYEFKINGVHHNPVTVKLPRSTPIKKSNWQMFDLHASNMIEQLQTHAQLAQK